MHGEERYLAQMFEGTKTRFLIPVYQRNYDWKVENCRRLFSDLEDTIADGRESHFFGSIVSKSEREARVIIDGQQRITTTFLLLLALVHQVERGAATTSDPSFVERVSETYLIDKWHPGDEKLKLKLVKDDQRAFSRLFDFNEDRPLIEESNITQNYLFFLQRIAETELDADQILEAIEKLMVIDISLDVRDDAQLIFESLNSTGLDLSEGDKIRNYILMGLESGRQNEYYERYWNPIEKNTDYDVSAFVRDWLAARRRQTPAVKKVYSAFRDFVRSTETGDLLEELLKYSRYYGQIKHATTGSPEVNRVLRRLNLLDMSVMDPFLLGILEYRNEGSITASELVGVLETVENYIFRRWACKVPTNALNKVFETLHGEVLRGVERGGGYQDVLSYVLLSKEGSSRFPRDDEFLGSLDGRNYHQIQNNKLYLYDRLENRDSVERVDVIQGLQDETLTVEHIMPQTLSRGWREDLGDDAEKIHGTWLNRLANLTLTGYNSQYSNKRFVEKRDAKHGFSDSGLRINKYVASCAKWGEEELEARDASLRKDFLTLWPLPSSSYVPVVAIHEEHGLDEELSFTNRKIAAYTFMGSRYAAKNWVDMICGVMGMLYELDPAAIRHYASEEEFPARYFTAEDIGYCTELGEGIYYNPGSSTETKCEILRRIFSRVGLDFSELSFELYKQQEGDDE